MFKYCHDDECVFDLWGPTFHEETLSNHSHIENRAFSPYAKHEQEKEDIIKQIIAAAAAGETNLSFELDDCFSDEDLEDIQKEVMKRLR